MVPRNLLKRTRIHTRVVQKTDSDLEHGCGLSQCVPKDIREKPSDSSLGRWALVRGTASQGRLNLPRYASNSSAIPAGTQSLFVTDYPAMNHWAIFNRPLPGLLRKLLGRSQMHSLKSRFFDLLTLTPIVVAAQPRWVFRGQETFVR